MGVGDHVSEDCIMTRSIALILSLALRAAACWSTPTNTINQED